MSALMVNGGIKSTRQALNARRVTGGEKYFRNWRAMAHTLLNGRPFAGDPHAFRYRTPADAIPEAEFLRQAALMVTNQYPGNIAHVDPTPDFGRYNDSAFVQRMRKDGSREEYLKSAAFDGVKEFPKETATETEKRILEGEVMWEHMVGGNASRMEINREKFVLSPQDLIDRYEVFYKADKEEKSRKGGLSTLPPPETIAGLAKPNDQGIENSELFGVRHMLAFAFNIKKLADKHGVSWQDALSKQTVFMIANEKIFDNIIGLFKAFGYFGLDSSKVFFMASSNYDALVLTERGRFIEQPAEGFIHNHGAARLETTTDNTWFTVNGGERKKHPAEEIARIYGEHANLQSQPIEDLDYLMRPIDTNTITLALNTETLVGGNYNMMMDVVGQKPENPQKGGVLVFDPDFFEPDEGRVVMIEAFQTYPRFFHYIDKVARRLWRNIKWLNLNMNNYPDPQVLFKMIQNEGLPVWFEVKNGGFRNESPQGDANYGLRTLFVARTEIVGQDQAPITIRNLKDAGDIPNGLRSLWEQQEQPGFWELVSEFRRIGMALEDYSFAQMSYTDRKTPIDIKTVLAHPFLMKRMKKRHLETLTALREVFQVEGSHVYGVRMDEDKVFIQLSEETRRGSSTAYKSEATGQEKEASKKTAITYKESRVWTDSRKGYSYVAIGNQGAAEVLMLLGSYNEDVPGEKKPEYLESKLSHVKRHMEDYFDGQLSEDMREKVIEEFKNISWQFLFEETASTIARAIYKKVKPQA